ncbi:hypothetical protein IV203_010187 [Nitzschia inconspicua]|uniref:Uncharacterized protein n=1 Tax=Nitzschia inconspicua TaxID=303405 RepID=A0A9K3KWM7_9STRA|nr:hypothetical protein IV203_010187 [Nitzschia inconspicua]
MRGKQSISATEQLISFNTTIDVMRVRSSDSTQPVHTTSKSSTTADVPELPMTPPRTSSKSGSTLSPTTPRLSSESELSPWRCKETSSIFRAAPFIPRTTAEMPNDFWTIQRTMAFDEEDAEC